MKFDLKKGQQILFKAPPLFEREYVYVITACGDKLIRADLLHSPKVKKHWTHHEFDLLIKHGVITLVDSPAE